jgi:hypothetical protein
VVEKRCQLVLPADMPAGYAALVRGCLEYEHARRPGFEEVVYRIWSLAEGLAAELATSEGAVGAGRSAGGDYMEVAAVGGSGGVLPGVMADGAEAGVQTGAGDVGGASREFVQDW